MTTTPTADPVQLALDGPVARITLDSPATRNALSERMVTGLLDRLEATAADESVHVVLLGHTGPTLTAGADLNNVGEVDMKAMLGLALRVVRAITAHPKPVVGRVGGSVRAGGLGIVGACDLAFASDDATFAFPEVRLGLVAAVAALTTLPALDRRAAQRYLLTGESFAAPEAVRIGLITDAVAADALDEHVDGVAAALARTPPQGLVATKRLLNDDLLASLDERGPDMIETSARLFSTPEAQAIMTRVLAARSAS